MHIRNAGLSADGSQVQEGALLGAAQQRTKHDGCNQGPPEQGRDSRTREALVETIGAAVSQSPLGTLVASSISVGAARSIFLVVLVKRAVTARCPH